MRITKDSPLEEKQKVRRVLLDGKPLLDVIEFDTEEGWARVLLPKLPTMVEHAPPNPETVKESDAEKNVGSFGHTEKVLQGTVTVELAEESNAKT